MLPIQLKQCDDCKSLCSHSATKCQFCGSRKLVKGFYSTKGEVQQNCKQKPNQNENEVILCPLCCAPVPISEGRGYCIFCDDEMNTNFLFEK